MPRESAAVSRSPARAVCDAPCRRGSTDAACVNSRGTCVRCRPRTGDRRLPGSEEVRLIVVDTAGGRRWSAILISGNLRPERRWRRCSRGRRLRLHGRRGAFRAGRSARRRSGRHGQASTEAEGLRAVCLQHEIDHLDGILFIDHISRLKRSMYVRRRREGATRRAERRCQESSRKGTLSGHCFGRESIVEPNVDCVSATR